MSYEPEKLLISTTYNSNSSFTEQADIGAKLLKMEILLYK